ncbi:deoxyribonuclease IV [Clostridium algidicarnis]|uniref:deoxyribonuclease IV n=1 Tax=Clostridium algidicarnis TaxID=37659 RepID=UPI001C0E1146|nr:deoxyribonuclease IV [Clostridium algidicarnis]MBU3227092.1 deoxyribonuclease IV [Clostridium algidicarnis]MBU3250617.1 deoxyribonuclease IV [Clostridium algidicarnis]
MLNIGCHLSSSKGFKNMGENALKIGANTFQFFTRNPRGSKAKDIDEKDVEEFLELAKENNFGKILAHAPYTLNPCSADDRNREFAIEIMKDDLNRMEYIPNNLYNFHPGNHVKQGVESGIEYIVYALNSILKEEQTTKVLLETMSGKGTEIGRNFEEIAEIIKGVSLKDHIGVCLDTCHIYDAGYDIVNELDKVLDEFDRIIGLDKLCAIHLNDSKNPFKSHKDRHETIGEGYIGLDAISNIINHKKLRHLPFFLETPNELEGHKREIELLKSVYKW